MQAQTQLTKLASKRGGDKNVVNLDLAIVDLLQGNPHGAEQRLREVRDNLDHLEQTSLAEAAAAVITDDQRRSYEGGLRKTTVARLLDALELDAGWRGCRELFTADAGQT